MKQDRSKKNGASGRCGAAARKGSAAKQRTPAKQPAASKKPAAAKPRAASAKPAATRPPAAAGSHDRYSDDYIADILRAARVFAFVGASANSVRPSYFAMKYLLAKGYQVHPVNPGLAGQQILGQPVYASLADVPAPVDVIDIFRNSAAALGVAREAIAARHRLGLKVLWMQLGVRNDEAAAEAEAAGLKVVMNRCPKIEYGRLSGEIGWAGVSTGQISNIRPKLSPLGVQGLRLADKR